MKRIDSTGPTIEPGTRLGLGSAALAAVLALAFASPALSQAPRTHSDYAAQGAAKVLCSAVFVSKRHMGEAIANSMGTMLNAEEWDALRSGNGGEARLDREAGEVHVTLFGFTGRARFYGDQGCVILPPGFDQVFFEPVEVESSLPDAAARDWPMGDAPSQEPLPDGLDPAEVGEAVDLAFEGDGLTAAFVAVYKGRIIGERYAQGAGRETQLESWSMGKSLTATLVGVLIEQGRLGLHDPAPVDLWRRSPEDPRSRIRVSDLLRMSGGLRFSHYGQPYYEWGRAFPDHLYIYTGAIDAFSFSLHRTVQFPPNTSGRYRNCDPLTLGHIIRTTVEEMGENYLAWPQKALFDRIGIRKQVLEPDPYGNFLLTGYDYGTGRNWARLGLLYLQDGVWEGERILPEGFAEFVSRPAPAWDRPIYGGLFWINGDGRWNAPESAYYMAGAGGQHVIIVPTHDLVVARLGHTRGQRAGQAALNRALKKLIAIIEKSQPR